jgi:hypothetical protein
MHILLKIDIKIVKNEKLFWLPGKCKYRTFHWMTIDCTIPVDHRIRLHRSFRHHISHNFERNLLA